MVDYLLKFDKKSSLSVWFVLLGSFHIISQSWRKYCKLLKFVFPYAMLILSERCGFYSMFHVYRSTTKPYMIEFCRTPSYRHFLLKCHRSRLVYSVSYQFIITHGFYLVLHIIHRFRTNQFSKNANMKILQNSPIFLRKSV